MIKMELAFFRPSLTIFVTASTAGDGNPSWFRPFASLHSLLTVRREIFAGRNPLPEENKMNSMYYAMYYGFECCTLFVGRPLREEQPGRRKALSGALPFLSSSQGNPFGPLLAQYAGTQKNDEDSVTPPWEETSGNPSARSNGVSPIKGNDLRP